MGVTTRGRGAIISFSSFGADLLSGTVKCSFQVSPSRLISKLLDGNSEVRVRNLTFNEVSILKIRTPFAPASNSDRNIHEITSVYHKEQGRCYWGYPGKTSPLNMIWVRVHGSPGCKHLSPCASAPFPFLLSGPRNNIVPSTMSGLHTNMGSLLINSWFACILSGVLLFQTYLFFRNRPEKDRRVYGFLVSTVFFVSFTPLSILMRALGHYFGVR